MNLKTFAALSMILSLASCNRQQKTVSADQGTSLGPVKTRVERSSNASGSYSELRTALVTAKLMEPGAERDKALSEIAWRAMEPAPEIFTVALMELSSESPGRTALIQAAVASWMKRSYDEAVAWADSLVDPELVAMAKKQIVANLAENHPEQAIQLLPESSFSDADPDPAAVEVVQYWTLRAPADAVAWVAKLPAGEGRRAGVHAVLGQWLEADADAAVSWVSSQADPTLQRDGRNAIIELYQLQPQPIRDAIIGSADSELRAGIERSIANNILQSREESRTAAMEPKPEPEPEPEPESDEDGGP